MITIIRDSLKNLSRSYDRSEDVGAFIRKICIDSLLDIKNDEIDVIVNQGGDLNIKYNDNEYFVDIKMQNINKTYSFPNMISIKKAKDILSIPNKHIIYIFVEYEEYDTFNKLRIDKISVQRIETLNWGYLYIQNLGKGQLQIKNMTKDEFYFNNNVTREEWLIKLKEKGAEYYDNLMLKVVEYKTEWEKDEPLDN
jgi:hypothetical protein